MTEAKHKDPKQGLKPHTGMIEFRYSKIFEDYLRSKAGKWDLDVQHKLNPKRDAVCVVLYNIQDDLHTENKDIKVESFILRSGNFGTPQVPSNYNSITRQESVIGSLPTIDEAQPSMVGRSFTEISLRDSALGLSRAPSSKYSLDKISLPSIKPMGRHSISLSKRKLLGTTSLNADKAKMQFIPKPPSSRRGPKLLSSGQ